MTETESGALAVRQAHPDDREAVVAFTADTWPQLDGDYIPRVFDEWVETDGPTQRTFVATLDDDPVGICQAVRLTDHEAWGQGLRVHPEHRGADVSRRLTEAVLEWARDRGATVCRNMVFSWNAAGLGQTRAMGFDPVAAFRWAEVEADPDADPSATGSGGADPGPAGDVAARSDPAVAWSGFHGSDAYHELSGLGLDLEESWALAEVTRARLADAESTLAITDGSGVRAATYRTRTFEHEDDDGETYVGADYGVGSWDDHEAFRALEAAVARDAAEAGADRARMLIPETPRHVSDAAYARAEIAEEPDFVMERDLLAGLEGERPGG